MNIENQARLDLGQDHIAILPGCAQPVSLAIAKFRTRWGPYSAFSRRYPILRLIQELIDPAIAEYMDSLPNSYKNHVAGIGSGVGFSEIIRLIGLEAMVRMQRQLLRQFIKTSDEQTQRDQCFVATIESLIELTWDCTCKRPKKSTATKGVNLNVQRKHSFCEFCGNLTEYSKFMLTVEQRQTNEVELIDHKKLELSHNYCKEHRPKLANDEWNPSYKQAKRSLAQFNIELSRLAHQSAHRAKPHAMSGDKLIDDYFFLFMLNLTLQPADVAELRNLARKMVDSKLSDNKKKMLVLQHYGYTQSQIGTKLLSRKQQPMTPQAVSKALAAVRKDFVLPANRPGKSQQKF
ncbi:transcriptional regulator [Vibrio cholerae]|uniref:LuxR family transcriptional regulator n=1 Tax=Vibrio cholerae TaxID=666 RepID=UPI000F0AF6FA|nr:LuxR family transcriptional regulator [Vibrio cholerae]EGQ7788516.1 LuxR family transcriptional regulator [Vibrio cholerae]EGR1129316.1 LuxR family transcriptional regulator [Vibrio cholerae]EJH6264833.1 transcriptional regulator [Vibrio cholerae]EJL6307037.1 transcriptional regulator [Vibrio cholerae]EJL6419908.1 transcriptional regulator [Vibrio cholerae]